MKAFLFFLLCPFLTQALEFKSFVNKSEVGLNETFVLNLQFESKDSLPEQVVAEDIFRLKDFHFLDVSNSTQSSIQIINAQVNKTSTLLKSYRLQPKAVGFFKIPSITVTADGKTFQTEPIDIKVVQDSVKKPNPSLIPRTAPSFPFNIPDPFQMPNSIFQKLPDLLSNPKDLDVRLKLELSKRSVYKSERIRANWFILSNSRFPQFDLSQTPDLKGFWKESIKNAKAIVGTQAIGNTLYRKQLVDGLWLFPLKSGELELDIYSVRLLSFFRNGQIISSPLRKITVKNLPKEGLDETFTGAVGDFSVEYLMKKKFGAVNEPLSLKITFKGSGHPRFVDLPQIPFPSSVETYPPVQRSQFSEKGEGIKEFEILIVPKQEGQLIIPSFTLRTFNPESSQYVSHKSPEFSVSITGGKPNSNLGESFLSSADTDKKDNFLNQGLLESSYLLPSFINYKNLIQFFNSSFLYFYFFFDCCVFLKKLF